MIGVYSPKRKSDPGLVLVTEGDFKSVLHDMLDQARKTVDLVAFSFAAGGENGRLAFRSEPFRVMERLKELALRGVRVRVFLEGHRDTSARNRVTGAHLEKAGVQVVYGSSHAKAIAVDGRYLLLGSSNLTEQSLTKNFETNLLIDHRPTAKQFAKYFEHYWAGGEHGEITLRAPLLADGAWCERLCRVIRKARRTLSFSIYFFDQRDVEAELIRAAERGVEITGLIHNHRSFGMDDVRRTRRTVARLREAGLDDLHFAAPVRFTHSKYLIRDRTQLLLGTGNWLDRDVNTHPQLYVDVESSALARDLERHLRDQIYSFLKYPGRSRQKF